MNNPIETRARELMLNPADKAAYLRLMTGVGRDAFTVRCPGCDAALETYETNILRHVRICAALREGN